MDRNRDAGDCTAAETASLSARRAWIEIAETVFVQLANGVALRKESVDRNCNLNVLLPKLFRRSPQGERG